MTTPPSSYDVIAYPSYTHVQTHPNRLAVVGTLFGLKPAPVAHCRVLELGCGNGSNLVPMAFGLPESEFVGIDLAVNPIISAREMAGALGLKNIQLIQGSIADFDHRHGKFDYIIAHGVFSWVPPEVRGRMLALCHECLAPHGVAFISYNALPGCHLRSMLREMMQFHIRDIQEPHERVRQAQALVQFLAEAGEIDDEYRLWMKSALDQIRNHEEGHLFHDELAECNQPYYFTQFTSLAAKHGLKYLAEADYFEMSDHGFSAQTREALNQLSGNRLLREQYLDFLRCRRFRQTLLCLAETPIAAEADSGKVTSFYISSRARQAEGATDLNPGKVASYKTLKGTECATDFALGKAALDVLNENELPHLFFDELFAKAVAKLAAAGITMPAVADARGQLAAFLLQLYAASAVDFRIWMPNAVSTVSERPVVSALAQWQIQRQNFVTSQFHRSIRIDDDVGRLILTALDGTLDHVGLLDQVLELLKSKIALVTNTPDDAATRRPMEGDLQTNLKKLARLGLLVA